MLHKLHQHTVARMESRIRRIRVYVNRKSMICTSHFLTVSTASTLAPIDAAINLPLLAWQLLLAWLAKSRRKTKYTLSCNNCYSSNKTLVDSATKCCVCAKKMYESLVTHVVISRGRCSRKCKAAEEEELREKSRLSFQLWDMIGECMINLTNDTVDRHVLIVYTHDVIRVTTCYLPSQVTLVA